VDPRESEEGKGKRKNSGRGEGGAVLKLMTQIPSKGQLDEDRITELNLS